MSRKQINQRSSKTNADSDTLGGRTAVGPRLGRWRWAEAGDWLAWRVHVGSGVLGGPSDEAASGQSVPGGGPEWAP